MRTSVSNGKSIDHYIPPHLRGMFYRHPTRPYARHNGLDPYGFSTNGLVLYLPLFALKGDAFKSVDRYGHTATVAGALWRPNGRLFDGTDDYIDLGTPTVLQDFPFSLMAWVKRGATGSNQMIIGSAATGWGFYFNAADTLALGKVGTDEVGSTSAYTSTTAWYHMGVTYDGTTAKFYADGSADGTPAYADPNFATVQKAVGIQINNLALDFNGLIGEIWGYNPIKGVGDFAHNRNATMWRYQ